MNSTSLNNMETIVSVQLIDLLWHFFPCWFIVCNLRPDEKNLTENFKFNALIRVYLRFLFLFRLHIDFTTENHSLAVWKGCEVSTMQNNMHDVHS